ncbi:uncharacterized protein LOC124896138 [Capsicum annuum]|uniref:uncharacterized protein LOC124896138 n=1 Tax=Capsicum annuum TaxID=4072 RepID=UPI001FB08B89|nr:uncharacterized protein LOC124896138 [Capsicum annuum]
MTIKLVIGGFTVHVCSAYVPQVGLGEEKKRTFLEVLDEVLRGVPSSKKLLIGGDFNGHIGHLPISYNDVHGGFGFGDRNNEGTALLDFARAFGLVVVNSSFPKKEEHLVTFYNEEEKRRFWEFLDEVVQGVPSSKKIFIGGDFNGHIRSMPLGYEDVLGGFGFGVRNDEGISILDFARDFGLVVVNSNFLKKEDHLATFRSRLAKS